jgi:hypothetical protein
MDCHEIIGGNLSKPSKMPCHGFGIPASLCVTGSKLRKIPGTVCNKCYTFSGFYAFPSVQKALILRCQALENPQWPEAMAAIIRANESSGYFRVWDSGDFPSAKIVANWMKVAELLPDIQFWIPTREYAFVKEYLDKGGKIPKNVTIRFSGLMIDGPAPTILAKKLGVNTSTVTKSDNYTCPAPKQGNKCLDCRNCWDRKIENIAYKYH